MEPSFDAVYSRVRPATIQKGEAIPLPQGETILTITGKVNAKQISVSTKSGKNDRIIMDRKMLEAVGSVEYEIQDLFEPKINRFRGVLMRDLLDYCQVSPEASQVTLTALNDYQITIPLDLLRQYPILLAMEQNGVTMQPDYRGPAMLVMPHEQYPSVKALADSTYWIWQISKIQIE